MAPSCLGYLVAALSWRMLCLVNRARSGAPAGSGCAMATQNCSSPAETLMRNCQTPGNSPPVHASKVRGSLISGPVKEAAIGRRTPGSTATS